MTARKLEKSEWTNFFNDFSKRLDGVEAEVEVAALKIGDQIEARWLPLYGIVYDHKDDIIEVALKGLDHMIQRPHEVFVEEDHGRLANLEVIDGDGAQQIIRFKHKG